jgi:hypothetical protein
MKIYSASIDARRPLGQFATLSTMCAGSCCFGKQQRRKVETKNPADLIQGKKETEKEKKI